MNDNIIEKYLEYIPIRFDMMINARAMIDESIDWHLAEVKVTENSKNKFKAEFKSDGLHYYFEMTRVGDSNAWSSSYDLTGNEISDRTIYDRLQSGKIHNGVFAAVIKCLMEFIKIVKPEYITFSSADKRLITFYKEMQKYIVRKLPLVFVKENETDGSVGWLYKVRDENG